MYLHICIHVEIALFKTFCHGLTHETHVNQLLAGLSTICIYHMDVKNLKNSIIKEQRDFFRSGTAQRHITPGYGNACKPLAWYPSLIALQDLVNIYVFDLVTT